MFEIFTDNFMSTINTFNEMMRYFKRLTFIFALSELFPRPPRNIGEIRRAIINKKHTYFHCRSMLR